MDKKFIDAADKYVAYKVVYAKNIDSSTCHLFNEQGFTTQPTAKELKDAFLKKQLLIINEMGGFAFPFYGEDVTTESGDPDFVMTAFSEQSANKFYSLAQQGSAI